MGHSKLSLTVADEREARTLQKAAQIASMITQDIVKDVYPILVEVLEERCVEIVDRLVADRMSAPSDDHLARADEVAKLSTRLDRELVSADKVRAIANDVCHQIVVELSNAPTLTDVERDRDGRIKRLRTRPTSS